MNSLPLSPMSYHICPIHLVQLQLQLFNLLDVTKNTPFMFNIILMFVTFSANLMYYCTHRTNNQFCSIYHQNLFKALGWISFKREKCFQIISNSIFPRKSFPHLNRNQTKTFKFIYTDKEYMWEYLHSCPS